VNSQQGVNPNLNSQLSTLNSQSMLPKSLQLEYSDLTTTVLNILLVEDNPGDVRLLQEILRDASSVRCQITPAMSLAAAIQQLSPVEAVCFDVILLDLSLPDSQGLASFLSLHRRAANIPIVVLTGSDDETLALTAMQQGAQDYLIKGQVDSNLLLRSIRYAIERERTEAALRQTKIELERRVIERTRDLQHTNQQLQLELLERQRAEAALQISQSRFAGILEIASDAIIAIDAERNITLFNQGAEQIFGYPAAESIGRSIDLLLPSEFITLHQRHVRRFGSRTLASQQMGDRQQVIGTRQDGSQFLAEASISYLDLGTEQVYTIVLRDVTERQQTENNLRDALHKLNFHFENSPLAAIEWDRDFRVSRWSATAEKMFGWQAAEVLGRHPTEWEHVSNEDIVRMNVTIERLTSGKDPYYVTTSRCFRKDGRPIECEWYNSALLDENGQMESVFSLALDVTDRHQIDRMKDEFVAIVSHELRTPLTSIYGSLSMLASGLLDTHSPKGKRLLDIAVDSTDRLMRLVNDILDIERIESGTVSMVKAVWMVSELMQKAIDVVQPLADAAGIRLDIDSSGGQVWVDADRIIQTFTNLLSNAIKFSPVGSTVWFSSHKQAGQVLFEVRDFGRGIPADKLGVIFEKFQQVDVSDARSGEGTGLGLAICKSIVQQHGGQIWVESVVGRGSTFSFVLPRSPSASDSKPK
jgi:PAS domain S-box-containing protein